MSDEGLEPVLAGRFLVDDAMGTATLLGVRCDACARAQYPVWAICKACGGTDLTPITLGPEATVWSRALDGIGFLLGRPYGVCWVEFDGGPIVQALLEAEPDQLPAIGDAVVAVPFVLPENDMAGGPYQTIAFRAQEVNHA